MRWGIFLSMLSQQVPIYHQCDDLNYLVSFWQEFNAEFFNLSVWIVPDICLSTVIPAKTSDAVKLGLLCLHFSFLCIFLIQKEKNKKKIITKYILMEFHTYNPHFTPCRCYPWRFEYWSSGKVLPRWLLRPLWSDPEQWVSCQPTRSCSSQLVSCQIR